MRVVRVSLSLLGAIVGATLTAFPCSAALGPQPAFRDSYGAYQPVREREERLADAPSGRFSALMEAQEEPRGEVAEPQDIQGSGDLASVVMDWLELAAHAYQAHVIEKLSVAVATAAGEERSEAPETHAAGLGAWLKETVRSAFGWLQSWVGTGPSERETAEDTSKSPGAPVKASGESAQAAPAGATGAAAESKAPPTPGSNSPPPKDDPPQQIAANDRSDEDARDFVEARRKADEALMEAQRLAELRDKTSEEKRRAEADLARRKEEAELKAREEELKAEMARKHEENQRRINESLKKLDEAQRAGEAKRREAERAKEEEARKAADKRAALEAEEAAEAQRVAEEASRKADAEKRMLALTSPPVERAPESAGAAPAGTSAPPPPVRADVMPELRLPSARAKATDATAPPPESASGKNPAETKTAASEPAPAAQSKAAESMAAEAKPKVERRKSARQPAKRARAQRHAREAREPRRRARLVYVVRPGDTLSAIAERYLGSGKHYDVIYRANRHRIKNPNVIHAYQRIVVPRRKA